MGKAEFAQCCCSDGNTIVAVAFGFGEKEDTWWDVVRTIWEEDGEDEEGEYVSDELLHEWF